MGAMSLAVKGIKIIVMPAQSWACSLQPYLAGQDELLAGRARKTKFYSIERRTTTRTRCPARRLTWNRTSDSGRSCICLTSSSFPSSTRLYNAKCDFYGAL